MNDITFSRALQSVMLDNKYDRFVKNRRTGKLDTKGLYKIETSSKLFKKREARKNKHYAVSLVVDVSGSMMGEKISVAAESAQKLSDHLSKIGIPHNVITFGLTAHEIKKFNAKADKEIKDKVLGKLNIGKLSDREEVNGFWDTTELVVSKKNSKKKLYKFLTITEGRNNFYDYVRAKGIRFGSDVVSLDSPSWNTDAEALKFARDKILKEIGKKIIIHLSDGQPAPIDPSYESPLNPGYSQRDFDLKHEVQMTLAAGIELYSVGILSDEVNKYYPPKRTGTIADIKQLYPHIIMLIRKNLRRG